MNQIFKEKNIKLTKSRIKVYDLILKNKEMTLKEIISNCLEFNKTTIYRTIEIFLENEIIIKKINNNIVAYKINNNTHNHFIKCIKCHKKVKIDLCPIENIDTKGFKIIKHSVSLDGICDECLEN